MIGLSGITPGTRAIRHLICLVILIINIYGLGVGISTIKKFTLLKGDYYATEYYDIEVVVVMVL